MSEQASDWSIGGFFGLHLARAETENSIWRSWTKNAGSVHALRNGRSALRHYLRVRSPRRIWLPAYGCRSLMEGCEGTGVDCMFYPIAETLDPDRNVLRHHLRGGDAVLVIDYFGRPPSHEFVSWARTVEDVDWIEDCAQALAPQADADQDWADHRLFSPRKLLGVIDGGLLVSRQALPAPSYADALPHGLAEPAVLRLEDPYARHSDVIYAHYAAVEAAMTVGDLPITRLSRAILETTEIAPLIEARQRNVAVLSDLLAAVGLIVLKAPAYAPFGYPIRVSRRYHVSDALRSQKIFVPVHWREILADGDEFPFELALSRQLLTLPCDHRYTVEDMRRLATAVLEVLE